MERVNTLVLTYSQENCAVKNSKNLLLGQLLQCGRLFNGEHSTVKVQGGVTDFDGNLLEVGDHVVVLGYTPVSINRVTTESIGGTQSFLQISAQLILPKTEDQKKNTEPGGNVNFLNLNLTKSPIEAR